MVYYTKKPVDLDSEADPEFLNRGSKFKKGGLDLVIVLDIFS